MDEEYSIGSDYDNDDDLLSGDEYDDDLDQEQKEEDKEEKKEEEEEKEEDEEEEEAEDDEENLNIIDENENISVNFSDLKTVRYLLNYENTELIQQLAHKINKGMILPSNVDTSSGDSLLIAEDAIKKGEINCYIAREIGSKKYKVYLKDLKKPWEAINFSHLIVEDDQ